jgi:hypothetical protein
MVRTFIEAAFAIVIAVVRLGRRSKLIFLVAPSLALLTPQYGGGTCAVCPTGDIRGWRHCGANRGATDTVTNCNSLAFVAVDGFSCRITIVQWIVISEHV